MSQLLCLVVELIAPPGKDPAASSTRADSFEARNSPPPSQACGGSRAGGGQTSEVGGSPGGGKARPTAAEKCKRIVTFMFKGGVYKTSTTINAAAALSGKIS
jgi:Mrp family chromosome partitioning ATPase